MSRLALVVGVVVLVGAACAGGPECRFNSDCTYGSYCLYGSCYTECRQSMDCMHGLVCDPLFGRCTTPDSDGGIPQEDGPAPQDGPTQHDGAPQEDAAPQEDGGVGQYTDPCAHASECESQLCLTHPVYLDGHCLPEMCSSITQCQMGDICVEYQPVLTVPNCVPSDIGHSCNGSGQCLYSCAYNQLQGIGICTNPCTMAADCPAGYTCSPYGSPAAMLCMPPDVTPCYGHDDCVFTVNALGGIAACVEGTGPPGRCLNTCRNTADCPSGYACQDLGMKVCVPPGPPDTGKGALGQACNNDGNKCRSGLCLGTYCTEKCSVTHAGQFCPYDYDAPPTQYGCLNTSDGAGGQTLVCVKAGAGDVGASCTDQSSCRTALCLTDNNSQTYCTKFCNDGICPTAYSCQDVGVTADGVALKACAKQ